MRQRIVMSIVVVGAFGLAACDSKGDDHTADGGGGGDGDGGGSDASTAVCIEHLSSIALTPADSQVTLDLTVPAPIIFSATGTFDDGHSEAIDSAKLDWSVNRQDDTPPGMIGSGVLMPYPLGGGTVNVVATDSCKSGSTTVVFNVNATIGTPTNPGDWTGVPTTAGMVPLVVYPSDQTRFPRNIYRTLFQWRTGGYSEFRLTFEGQGSTVVVYTDGADPLCAGKNPAAGCFEAGETAWELIAGSNAGSTVTWTIDALDHSTTPPTIRRAAPITIGFSRRDVKGAVFYWSTTSAGIRRANVADAVPEDYVTGKPGTVYPDGEQVNCVACHVVSRDGKYLIAPTQADWDNSLTIYEVTAQVPPPTLVEHVDNTGGHGFATISPDDMFVIPSWAGKMWMIDRATGGYLSDLPLGAVLATQPDWSPDNTQVVFATGKGDAPGNAKLNVIPYLGGQTWGTPTLLTAPPAMKSNLFPQFSPDGTYVAYSQGKGGHDDLTAQLFVIPSGGGDPVELLAGNRVVNNATTLGQHQNSQPTWAPPSDEDLDFIAFNSMRPYGVVSPAGTQQIWVIAIDKSKLGTGADPSFPAFRLQFQGLEENNHRAYWTLDIRDPDPDQPDAGVPADSGMCIAAGDTCDPSADVCCDSGFLCDSDDEGLTYSCVMPPIP